MPIPLKVIVPKLDRLRLRSTLNRLGKTAIKIEDATTVSDGLAAVLGLVSVFAARKPVTETVTDAIVDVFGRLIEDQIESSQAQGGKIPLVAITLYDSAFAMLTGRKEILDLRSGELTQKIPQAPIEIVAYDLRALLTTLRKEAENATSGPVEK
jgi:hypothetical protein